MPIIPAAEMFQTPDNDNYQEETTPRVEKRIELPKMVVLQKKANSKLQATIEKLKNQPVYDLMVAHDPGKEYVVPLAGGGVTIVADTVTINGLQWPLVPGHNKVPKSVYEVYTQAHDQKRLMASANRFGMNHLNMKPNHDVYYGAFSPTY